MPPPTIINNAPSPIPIAISVEPVAGIVGDGFVADPPLIPALLVAVTVIVCTQLPPEVLTPLASSVSIADAWNVPGLL